MITVYSRVEDIPVPEFSTDWDKYRQLEEAYVEKIRAYATKHGKGAYAGKEVSFQVADGYACYVILSTTPCKLIHLAIGDAWHFQYIERLTSKDIVARVKQSDALATLFNK